jgi:uncharacterized caspase-like protein
MFGSKLVAVSIGILVAWAFATGHAAAERRLALVIGNNVYPNLPARAQLQKAVNDSDAVARTLSALGFDVIQGRNLGRQGMIDRISDLTAKIQPGDTVAFFYAGHGVAIGGANYLVPSDVPATSEGAEARVRGASIPEADVVAEMQGKGARLVLLVLDACRDNPFPRTAGRSIGNTRGLADAKPVRGVFTIYSAGIGQTALDRLEQRDSNPNSVFTRVFIEQLKKPDLHLADVAVEVRERVASLALQAKNEAGQPDPHEQTPAYYDQTLGGRIFLARLPGADGPRPSTSTPAAPAPAGRKLALVIGNAAYTHVPALKTPTKEADVIGRLFRRLNFDSVKVLTNVTHAGMRDALRQFSVEAAGADWAVLYFTGHGIQARNENYVVAVDVSMAGTEADAAAQSIGLPELLAAVDPARHLRLVIVDSMRYNPFAPASSPRTDGIPPINRPGTFVLYSAESDQFIEEGDDVSAFAKALDSRLGTPGLDLQRAAALVQQDVLAATKQKQKPVLYGFSPAPVGRR